MATFSDLSNMYKTGRFSKSSNHKIHVQSLFFFKKNFFQKVINKGSHEIYLIEVNNQDTGAICLKFHKSRNDEISISIQRPDVSYLKNLKLQFNILSNSNRKFLVKMLFPEYSNIDPSFCFTKKKITKIYNPIFKKIKC